VRRIVQIGCMRAGLSGKGKRREHHLTEVRLGLIHYEYGFISKNHITAIVANPIVPSPDINLSRKEEKINFISEMVFRQRKYPG